MANEKQTTCQICGRQIKANTGIIAHHGYQRPYQAGWQTASCRGARELPYEVSKDLIPPVIESIEAFVVRRTKEAKEFTKNPPEILKTVPHYIGDPRGGKELKRPDDFSVEQNEQRGSWGYGDAYGYEHHSQLRAIKQSIEWAKHDLVALRKRLAEWKPVYKLEDWKKEYGKN